MPVISWSKRTAPNLSSRQGQNKTWSDDDRISTQTGARAKTNVYLFSTRGIQIIIKKELIKCSNLSDCLEIYRIVKCWVLNHLWMYSENIWSLLLFKLCRAEVTVNIFLCTAKCLFLWKQVKMIASPSVNCDAFEYFGITLILRVLLGGWLGKVCWLEEAVYPSPDEGWKEDERDLYTGLRIPSWEIKGNVWQNQP